MSIAQRTVDYSGQPFGKPGELPVEHAAAKAEAVASTLKGQDSISVNSMSRGLAVYCGYEAGNLGYRNGTYNTMAQVLSVFTGKKYISVGRDVIDIEPGLASVWDAAGFVHNAKPVNTAKPVIYCSAGDLRAVISALNAAGIPRSAYYLWSAHWTGEHICGPSTCGYPQCDATQYASNNSYDSDVFSSSMFGAVNPWPLVNGSVGTLVVTLQNNLNTWASQIGLKTKLTPDGAFGPATAAAVTQALVHFGIRSVAAGTCTEALFNDLAKSPAPTPVPVKPPAPPTPKPKPEPVCAAPVNLKVDAAGKHSVKFEFANPKSSPVPVDHYQVVIFDPKGKEVWDKPREIKQEATGKFTQQYGGLAPATTYKLQLRAVAANGHQASKWAEAKFTTAK